MSIEIECFYDVLTRIYIYMNISRPTIDRVTAFCVYVFAVNHKIYIINQMLFSVEK